MGAFFRLQERKILMKKRYGAGLLVLGLVSAFALITSQGNKHSVDSQVSAHLDAGSATSVAPAVVARGNGLSASSAPASPESDPVSSPSASAIGRSTPVRDLPLRRAWDGTFFDTVRDAAVGDEIVFELIGGKTARGVIRHLEHGRGNEVLHVAGVLSEPEKGRFFFQQQTAPGVAGPYVGVVELPASQRAYRLEAADAASGAMELVERPLKEVRCIRLPQAEVPTEQESEADREAIPPLKPGEFPTVPIPPHQAGIVVLESLPGSLAVIYLDFQGGYTPTWGGIEYQRPNVSNAQIRDVWVRVAEDYMPFGINVTTDLDVYRNAPERSRQRVIITPTSTAEPGAGGVAYIGSFNWTGDTPCWVFITSGKNCAEAASHEAGHTLGLSHDGRDVNGTHTEYYDGHGTGDLAWAPIMGTGYSRNVSQWSKGEYANASNTQDDLRLITTRNNDVLYRGDESGGFFGGARYLEIKADYSVMGQGVIQETGDTDAYRFTTFGGGVTLRADPVGAGPNLALEVSLQDEWGGTLATVKPASTLYAFISTNLPAGNYAFVVSGSGRKTVDDGFSNYASLGFYALSGAVANARRPDRFTLPEHSPAGTSIGPIGVNNPDGHQLEFQIISGNEAGAFGLDPTGMLTVVNAEPLDYETLALDTQMPVQFELFIDVRDLTDGALSETGRRVVVAIANVNEPPTLADTSISILERTAVATPVVTLMANDPDFYTLLSYSIVAGNADGLFALHPQSGVLSVAREVATADLGLRKLKIVASDQAPGNPLVVTSTVTVNVLPNATPLKPGSIAYAAYTNIAGSEMSTLLSSPRFPYEPSLERLLTRFEAGSNWADRYGAAVRGYVIPPASGNYTFWIASDDGSQLWLSASTNPATMTQIATVTDGNWTAPQEWDRFASQKSRAITLAGGQAYYIEARLREITGNDHLAVAWECAPAGIAREVIPGRFLAPYAMNYTPRPVVTNLSVHRDTIEWSRLTTVGVFDANTNDTHRLTIAAGNTGAVFALDPITGVLRLASEEALRNTTQTTFNLTIRAEDDSPSPRAGTTNLVITVVETNAITAKTLYQELFYTVGSGNSVADLTNKAKFPKRPDALRPISSFQGGDALAENYGSRIRASLVPPTSGTHYLFIASDDSSSLRYSATGDASAVTPVAWVNGSTSPLQWNKYSSQRSQPLALSTTRRVYVEVLHKEGGGDDHVAVGWVRPEITTTNVIPVTQLQPVDLNYAPELVGGTITLPLSATNATVVTMLVATDSPADTITYKIISGNTGDAFEIHPDSGIITVANNKVFATFAVSEFTLRVQAQDSGYGGLFPRRSAFADLRILIADDSPVSSWQGAGHDDRWSTAENWTALPPEGARLRFSGALRTASQNDLLTSVGLVEIANSGFYLSGNPLVLLAGLNSSGDNTWAIDSTLNSAQTIRSTSGTLTFSGDLDNNGHELLVDAQGPVVLSGELAGSGALRKAGAATLSVVRGNPFSGSMAVEAGRLAITDAAALGGAKSVVIQAGATLEVADGDVLVELPPAMTLSGQGQVEGRVALAGVLAPGTSDSRGTLSFSSDLLLAGRTEVESQKLSTGPSHDAIRVLGDLTLGGDLVVTHTGLALAAGDSFRFFEAARIHGAFTSVSLPALSPGLLWHTGRLSNEGVLAVTAVAPQIRPVFMSASGGLVIEFQGVGGVNYEVQAAEHLSPDAAWNTVGIYSGGQTPTTLILPIDPARPSRFYRLRIAP